MPSCADWALSHSPLCAGAIGAAVCRSAAQSIITRLVCFALLTTVIGGP